MTALKVVDPRLHTVLREQMDLTVPELSGESLYSCLRTLETKGRLGFISWLKGLGVGPQPVRQKIANGLARAKREGTLCNVTPPAWDYRPPPPPTHGVKLQVGAPSSPPPHTLPLPPPPSVARSCKGAGCTLAERVPSRQPPDAEFLARRRAAAASSATGLEPTDVNFRSASAPTRGAYPSSAELAALSAMAYDHPRPTLAEDHWTAASPASSHSQFQTGMRPSPAVGEGGKPSITSSSADLWSRVRSATTSLMRRVSGPAYLQVATAS